MLKITDAARDKFKELLKEHEGKYLKVVFEGFGWGGPRLGLALDEPNENTKIHNINDIDVIIDDNILPYTENNQIDYIENSYGQGFSIAPTNDSNCC